MALEDKILVLKKEKYTLEELKELLEKAYKIGYEEGYNVGKWAGVPVIYPQPYYPYYLITTDRTCPNPLEITC
jgi:hypothetical protein